MVGGVFSQHLGATGNPAAKNAENNARDSDNHKDEKNRLFFVEVNKLPHPSDHRGEELTDQGKQSCENGSSSALKSSSFHKIFMAPVTDGAGEPTERKQQRRQ